MEIALLISIALKLVKIALGISHLVMMARDVLTMGFRVAILLQPERRTA